MCFKKRLLKYYRNKVLNISEKSIDNKSVLIDKYQAKIIKYSSYFDKKYYKEKYNLGNNVYLAWHYLKEGYKRL